ncbi:hypothetical protein P171DRAFT_427802 [Karstenula rhodostoma CBS 690.94]|uniref:Uncharacterized protein n=1 Tax=Karstenula rhodostoma CBS 690.94 TaxID=1392251 RepID=A0A9P4PSU9_9PLEO|nr:hypothetical protein P171DRAFT_427802 [Karstenula rhodostoma CBS 690.94]
MTSSESIFFTLPREIRNKIYRAVLCTFETRATTVNPPPSLDVYPSFMDTIEVAEHEIDTSILLVSKHIHKEAYDVMVKTNRFVRVTTAGRSPLRLLLNHLRVPVVTEDPGSVNSFNGYVLSVTLTFPREHGSTFKNLPAEPCSLMLLGRDMDIFCDILMDGDTYLPGFGTKTAMKIAVAPGSILSPCSYKYPISEFFSEKTQQVLLQPFRNRLRGFKKIKVRGLVSRSFAEAVEEELAQDAASDPETVLSKFQGLKDEGQNLYRSKQTDAANLKWMDAALEMEQLHESSSWAVLTEKGGVPFVARMSELYFLMKLNIAHIHLKNMQEGRFMAEMMASDALNMAIRSTRKDFWLPGFRWQPTDVHKAKLGYRRALFFRLEGNRQSIPYAVSSIENAHRLLPDDAAITKERETILAWRDLIV